MLALYFSMLHSEEEEKKFEELYLKYRDLMIYIANDILKDRSLAEDAVHHAFMKIINYMDGIEDVYSHKTKNFVVIVVRNLAKTMYVKRKRETGIVDFEEATGIQLAGSNDVEGEVVDSLMVEKIREQIEAMPAIYRDAMILKYFQGYDDREVADILNISYTAARKRIQRGKELLARLKKEL